MPKTCPECSWNGNSDWAQECELCGTSLSDDRSNPEVEVKNQDMLDPQVVI
jgi:hypothetical protein